MVKRLIAVHAAFGARRLRGFVRWWTKKAEACTATPVAAAPSRSPKSLEDAWYPHACAFLQRYCGLAPVGGSATLLHILDPSTQMTTTTCSTALPLSLCHSASLWQDQWIQPFSKVTATSRYSLTLRLACSHGLSSVTGHDVLGIHTLDPAFVSSAASPQFISR
ncbi:hypothetical protein BM1_01190 [Bipolaris maydis]|nr:hypothetical protein BM1_01190 [Bipolaris maydis]